jgi:hypothetical protein
MHHVDREEDGILRTDDRDGIAGDEVDGGRRRSRAGSRRRPTDAKCLKMTPWLAVRTIIVFPFPSILENSVQYLRK